MTQPQSPQREDVSLAELVDRSAAFGRLLWRERRRFVRPVAITTAIGLLIALISTEEYSASTQLLPYKNTTSAGGLSSLAGLAGIRLPTAAEDHMITAELYPVIGNTVDFKVSVAETPLRFASEIQPLSTIQYFMDRRSVVEHIQSWIENARSAISSMLGRNPGRPELSYETDKSPLRTYDRRYLDIIQDLDERLTVSIDKKTSVITIAGVMPDPYAAADLVQAASQQLMQRIIEYEAKKAEEQLAFTEEQYRRSRMRYEAAQRELAVFADRNRALISAVRQIERERLQREYDVTYEVLQQLSLELEQARIKKNHDTPVFTVLEQVVVPNDRSRPRRTLILLSWVFIGIVAGAIGILWSRVVVRRES